MEDMKRNLSVSKKKKVSRHLTVFARFLLAAAVAVLAFSCCCLAIHCLATDRIGDGFLKNKVLSSGSDPSEEAPKSHGGVENVNVSQRLYDVPVLLQMPELPAGCEATAAAMLLSAYGYDVDKESFAQAMPKSSFVVDNGRTYAAHPNDAYIGSPDSSYGYGAFAKVVAQTMQKLIDRADGNHRAVDISGSSEQEILACIDQGSPVCIWSTMSLLPLVESGSWYLMEGSSYTDEYFQWPGNEHCMILVGYDETSVTVHDPLKGVKTYDRDTFFQRYDDVGRYAVILRA